VRFFNGSRGRLSTPIALAASKAHARSPVNGFQAVRFGLNSD